MNIAVVDDQYSEIAFLCEILDSYAKESGLSVKIDRFESGEEFLASFRPFYYQVIFLDIYMEGITGIETAASLRQNDIDARIIILTSSDVHMREAFDVHAFQYLIKFQDPEKFRSKIYNLMNDILRRYYHSSQGLSFTSKGHDHHLPFSNILYLKSNNHNVDIVDISKNVYSPRMTFSSVQKQLATDGRFLLINRGLLVNMDMITGLIPPDFPKECELKGEIRLPINVREKNKILLTRQNYIFNKMHDEMAEKGGMS